MADAGDLRARDRARPRAARRAARRRWPGTLVACLAALFMALLGWLAWAQVDEVVQATGTVEPAGRVKIVNHPRGGRVAAIHVREGQRVEAGTVLVTLDGEVARSERSETAGPAAAARGRGRAARGRGRCARAPARARPSTARTCSPAQQALLAARNCRPCQPARGPGAGRCRRATASCARWRPRSTACATAWTLLSRQREAVRELAERGLYPALKVVEVERQYSDDAGELAKAKASLVGCRGGAGRGQEPDRGSGDRAALATCLAELAEATADRDRLARAAARPGRDPRRARGPGPSGGHRRRRSWSPRPGRRWRRTRP